MAVNMNLGDQANLAALLRSLVWVCKGNMHISSRLAAYFRLTGFCSSSFRGHFRSLFSPDYSVYWPPLCHGGFSPQPSLMAHHQLTSVQDWPYRCLPHISAMATGRREASGTSNHAAWPCDGRHTFPPPSMGRFIFICLPKSAKVILRGINKPTDGPHTLIVFFWLFFFFYSYVMKQTEASVIMPVHLSVAVWPVVMCQQTGGFFYGPDLLYLMSSQEDKCSLFVKMLLLLGRALSLCLGREQIPVMEKNDGMRFFKAAFFIVQMFVSDARLRCFFTSVWMCVCNIWLWKCNLFLCSI